MCALDLQLIHFLIHITYIHIYLDVFMYEFFQFQTILISKINLTFNELINVEPATQQILCFFYFTCTVFIGNCNIFTDVTS